MANWNQARSLQSRFDILRHESQILLKRVAAFRFAAGFLIELCQLQVSVRLRRIEFNTSL